MSHLTFAVFGFSDELILSILSHVSPDPRRYARFHFQHVMDTRDYHRRRMAFLLPLSKTCRAMRLRLLPWVWERVEVLPGGWTGVEDPIRRPTGIAGALRADPYLSMSVRYVHPFFVPGSAVYLCPLKISVDASPVGGVHDLFVRQMPRVPSKSPHTGDTTGGCVLRMPAQESP